VRRRQPFRSRTAPLGALASRGAGWAAHRVRHQQQSRRHVRRRSRHLLIRFKARMETLTHFNNNSESLTGSSVEVVREPDNEHDVERQYRCSSACAPVKQQRIVVEQWQKNAITTTTSSKKKMKKDQKHSSTPSRIYVRCFNSNAILVEKASIVQLCQDAYRKV